MATFMMISLHL